MANVKSEVKIEIPKNELVELINERINEDMDISITGTDITFVPENNTFIVTGSYTSTMTF